MKKLRYYGAKDKEESDYLRNKSDSDYLCRELERRYREMGLTDVMAWSEPFVFANNTNWAVRSNLVKKHPELFEF